MLRYSSESTSVVPGSKIYVVPHLPFRHYNSNRAPLGLFFHVNWFTDKTKVKAVAKFVDYIIENHNDAYFVTMQQALLWMRTPKKVCAYTLAHLMDVNGGARLANSGRHMPDVISVVLRRLDTITAMAGLQTNGQSRGDSRRHRDYESNLRACADLSAFAARQICAQKQLLVRLRRDASRVLASG